MLHIPRTLLVGCQLVALAQSPGFTGPALLGVWVCCCCCWAQTSVKDTKTQDLVPPVSLSEDNPVVAPQDHEYVRKYVDIEALPKGSPQWKRATIEVVVDKAKQQHDAQEYYKSNATCDKALKKYKTLYHRDQNANPHPEIVEYIHELQQKVQKHMNAAAAVAKL